ncbi:MAG: ABC transporter permease [Pleurocapsa minor GSE-CHR-MK-17-07R]|jgi:putative spermidine/putrescine transport system permease protein|nr:ABC transporter permease [Pleurocapsa minor GSE-CHR-MK 17-07R]
MTANSISQDASRLALPPPSLARRISSFFYKRPNVTLFALLSLPLLWLLVIYIGSIAAMLVQSFYSLDPFSGRVVRQFTLSTYQSLFNNPSNMDIVGRTVLMAFLVTLMCAVIAFPLSYYFARYAPKRVKSVLYLGVMLPLWSSYLVRVYAWKLILADEGIISWFFTALGLRGVLDAILSIPVIGGSSLSFSFLGMFIVFVYIWLPYMILPVTAALERVPKSLIEASGDLGGRPSTTFWKVILPLAFPGVIAGSIFTFSLTLGDYIIPQIIGNSSYFIGGAVYVFYGTAGNIPLAAAFTTIPIVIMIVYLLVARRLGAFDAL